MKESSAGSASKEPTLEDIAQVAGVSKMTASRALRQLGHVKADTRERVLDAARKLGYRPNPLVQTLMSGVRRSTTVASANLAWVTTYPPGANIQPAVVKFREGAERRARTMGFNLVDFFAGDPGLSPKRIASSFRARGIYGAVMAPLYREDTRIDFPWTEFPLAAVGRSIHAPFLHHTQANHHHQTALTIRELDKRGYRRLAYFPDRRMARHTEDASLMVFEHSLAGRKKSARTFVAWTDDWTTEDFKHWLGAKKPDAILFDFSSVAERVKEAGFRFPRDFGAAVLSLAEDNTEYSGISQPFTAIGSAAVDKVIAQIHRNERGIPDRPQSLHIEGDWFEGRTLREAKQPTAG